MSNEGQEATVFPFRILPKQFIGPQLVSGDFFAR
jgi:hypothetical protein